MGLVGWWPCRSGEMEVGVFLPCRGVEVEMGVERSKRGITVLTSNLYEPKLIKSPAGAPVIFR